MVEQTEPQKNDHVQSDVPECVLDDKARNFEPSIDEIFFIIPSGDYQRLIFTGMELREREQTHLNDFREFLKT